MSADVKAAVEAIEEKLTEAVSQYEGELKEYGEATKKISEDVKALSEEHAELVKEFPGVADDLKALQQKVDEISVGGAGSEKSLSWGDTLIESDSFKQYESNKRVDVEVKNTILGESSGEPSDVLVAKDRLPGIVPGAFRSLNVLDFVNSGNTNSNQIEYTRENVWTNAAAETAEGAQKPESTLTFQLVNDPVRTIAHIIKTSKQIMDDAPALASFIDVRMRHGVRAKLQSQIINGNGTSPNIAGLADTGRHTVFTPTASELALDGINRAKYAVLAADYSPNFIFMNPADFGAMERVKETGSSNAYASGGGAALSYINGGMTPLVWGIPVVVSNDIASGKFFLGDSSAFQLFMRQGVMVEVFEQDADNVQKNLLTVRAEMRSALAVYTPA